MAEREEVREVVAATTGEVTTLGYATLKKPWRVPWRRVGRGAIVAGIAAVVGVGLDKGIRKTHTREFCEHCGAVSEARYLNIVGIPLEYQRNVTQGLLSRFVMADDRRPCVHAWESSYVSKHTFFGRVRRRSSNYFHWSLQCMERAPKSRLADVLQGEAASDVRFREKLKDSLAHSEKAEARVFISDLWHKVLVDGLPVPSSRAG